MNTYIRIMLSIFIIATASCEDVIDVELQSAPIRLTVEASIDWIKETTGNQQSIKLSTSTPYFKGSENTVVTGALVKITNDLEGTEFIFVDQNNGTYTTTAFEPILNQSYTLEVIYEGEVYTANETMTGVTDILKINQSKNKGFDDQELEVNVVFQDPEDEINYYFFKFQKRGNLLPYLEDGDDEFVNGNEISWWYEDEESGLVPGDIVDIDFYGVSESYYNYLRILIEQNEGGGLFSSTPVALKGNCLNLTSPDNFAYGYFRLTQVVKTSYTLE